MGIIVRSKNITTLKRPIWLDTAGMTKGIGHDRQHLGIILPSGQSIKVRQINADFNDELTLRLLNDDNHTEAFASVGNSWVELSVNAVAVPFIDTPYGDVAPEVEYEYPDTVKVLPVYRKGENESVFFDRWDSQNAEFALVEAEYFIILVPNISKNKIKSLEVVSNIDGLIDYYESIFTFYNELSGLSFEPQRYSDRNIHNRYFIKADKHGPGGAYYGGNWTAESTSSISSYWLLPDPSNWGALHEIAHGYQGKFMSDPYFASGEVWNNIYAACYQSIMLGDRKYKQGWPYNYGNQAGVEKKIADYISIGKELNKWDLRSKLYFMMLMIEKAGMNAFTHFNQQYRLNCNSRVFVAGEHALLDMLSESFATVGNQVDVTPFIQWVGGHITPTQCKRNLFSHARAVCPLNQLFQGDELKSWRQALKLDSDFSLVDVQQLKSSGLKGNVTLRLNIDDFSQIYGDDLILLDGARCAGKLPINLTEMVLHDLPIGVYTLRLPTGKNKKYKPQVSYLVVKPGSSQLQVDFVRKDSSPIVSQKIILLGLGNREFANVVVDHKKGILAIDVIKKDPHVYFPNQDYARLLVRGKDNVELFSKVIPGNNATLSHDEVPFTFGDKIEIYHEEPHRMLLEPVFTGMFDDKNKTNVLQVTPSGLKNEGLNSDPQLALLARVEKVTAALRENYTVLNTDFSEDKDDIYIAINAFTRPQREEVMTQYRDCVPANNLAPGDKLGNAFTLAFNGISEHRFLTVKIDMVKKQMMVSLEPGKAHHYFDSTYAVLRYQDADGNELLNLDIKGNDVQKAQSWILPISGYGGEVLYLRHEEPNNRLLVTNEMQQLRVADRGKLQSYCLVPNGLVRIGE